MAKTPKWLMEIVVNAVGNGNVINIQPTEENPLGQAGIHTLLDDIVDSVDGCKDRAEMVRKLNKLFLQTNEKKRFT